MDLPRATESIDDLSALAWVQEELRRSLDTAHKALRRYLKESEALAGSDVDAVDPNVLRQARVQIHQGVGALELVGLPSAATLLRASEAAVARFVSQPRKLDTHAADAIERGSFALLDYLARMLAGKPVPPLALFPQYKALQELAGADRVHPADLWPLDWQWRDLPADANAPVRVPDAETRSAVEAQLLALMRQPHGPAAQQMSDVFAGLAANAADKRLSTLWGLAAAVFEALSHKLLPADLYSKRIASRLLAQLRVVERGEPEVSDRLAQDMLFFCAQAVMPADAQRVPRVAAARRAFGLEHAVPVDYETARLGRFDPALIAQARKRVAGARDAWSAVAGGELHRLSSLAEQFSLVGDSLKRLYPSGEQLADALQRAVGQTVDSGAAPLPALAMEVATSVLYLDASLEDADFDHPEQATRVQRLAHRIERVRQGVPSEPLEGWMEELYRRVSDRQTMGSVVQELRASLSESEKLIDQYFRNPAERSVLIPVPGQLQAMRGVLSVLGLDQASHAVLRMRDDVDELAQTEVDPQRAAQAGTFDRLAGNLGALGFLIDMLSVQPQMAKSLFVFDPEHGTLRSVVGGGSHRAPVISAPETPAAPAVEPRLLEQAQSLASAAAQSDVSIEDVSRDLERLSHEALIADQTSLAETANTAKAALERAGDDASQRQAVRDELAQAMTDFVATASDAASLAPPPIEPIRLAPMPTRPASPPTAPGATGLEDDAEMREIFLEEAREVMEGAHAALAALAEASDDLNELTTVRRAFHTLKGSSRMVGLKDFGEAAWACEQLYNARLADAPRADEDLRGFTADVLGYLGDWIDCIAEGRDGGHEHRVVGDAADLMRNVGKRVALPLPAASSEAQPEPAFQPAPLAQATLIEQVPELPSAQDLELPALAPVAEASPADVPLEAIESFESIETIDVEAAPPIEAAPTLELPTAFDQPFDAATPVGETDLPEVAFDLDLGALDEPATGTEPMPLAQAVEMVELDFDLSDSTGAPPPPPPAEHEHPAPTPKPPVPEPRPEPEHEPKPRLEAEPVAAAPVDPEQFKVIGPLSISIPLFNIYLNEADELSRRLGTELAEWQLELHRPVGDNAIALAHSLAGNSATVGFADLSQLSRALEHALMRSNTIGRGDAVEAQLFLDVAEEIRRLLHQFAAGFLPTVPPVLLQRLADHERHVAERAPWPVEEEAEAAAPQVTVDAVEPVAETPVEAVEAVAPIEAIEVPAPELIEPVFEAPVESPSETTLETPFEAPVTVEAVAPETSEPVAVDEPVVEEPAALVEAPAPVEPVAEAVAVAEAPVLETAPAPLAGLAELGQPELKAFTELPKDAVSMTVSADALDDEDDIDAVDAVDAELFPIFEEEGQELLPQLASRMRDWARRPGDASGAAACMRTLHTLKGGARLAGAMRLGEMAHRLETAIEHLLARGEIGVADMEPLQQRVDALSAAFETVRSRDAQAYAEAGTAVEQALPTVSVIESEPMPLDALPLEPLAPAAVVPSTYAPLDIAPAVEQVGEAPAQPVFDAAPRGPEPLPIDWKRLAGSARVVRTGPDRSAASHAAVRVRAPLLDRLVNHAGEVSITRSRIESDVGQLKGSLADLTENLERLRRQLRDIELQAETQIASRMEAAKAASQDFDPLEFDRFTRFQELTRMMAESVNDVATVQRSLQRTLQSAEDELAAQARLTRDLQDDLLRTRMVEFEGLSERLYRVVRQAAKETGKHVRLDIVGGSIEVDRGVLDRMTGAFEHLLRNCVTHGIEGPDARSAAGKDATGQITVALTHEGNEVGVEFRDDGGGLDLDRIRAKGQAMGLIAPDAQPTDAELANLIFTPGFSTADQVTELAGRGIGMDVVRSEVNAMGGRIETATARGQGTSFRLVLPLTTAVTQVVMLRCGNTTVAVPSTLVEIVRRAKPAEIEQAYASGSYQMGERVMPFFWLGALLQASSRGTETGRMLPVIVIRSAQQRVALHVDEVLGNQEVVVKNLGSQLSRLPGLAGMTLLASGAPALIYNPVALATLYGESARALMHETLAAPQADTPVSTETAVAQAPLVLVVDDSLTVRRVTQRLLVREGYRVALAKDGLEGLERLAEERPAVLLSDIEMPRMDGFDLVRNLRSDVRLRDLPVIMITSRIAQKHRDYAAELGVDHYLGKPYSEEDLLALVARYTAATETA